MGLILELAMLAVQAIVTLFDMLQSEEAENRS